MLSQGGGYVRNDSKNNSKDNVIELRIRKKVRPLTQHEKSRLEKLLYTWRDLIDHGKTDEATELLPSLLRCEDEHEDLHLIFIYNLFCARYYRALSETENFDEVMSFLSGWRHKFLDEHNYYYYRLIAFSEHEARRYKSALEAYYAAEESDPIYEWIDVGFYYSFGCCLMDMGYIHKAIGYLEKALEKANSSGNHIYDVYIKGYMAQILSKIGKDDDAIEILNSCLHGEKNRNLSRLASGWVHLHYGIVFSNLLNYDEAIKNYDAAFQFIEKNSELYIRTLYNKSEALIATNKTDEGITCINNGMGLLSEKEEWMGIWGALFDALRHSVSLHKPEAILHMKTTAIPKLLEFGQYAEAIYYYKMICSFYEEAGDASQALKYSHKVAEIYCKYVEDRVEGAV